MEIASPRRDAAVASIAAVVFVLCALAALDGVAPGEAPVFRAVNRLPDLLLPVVWLPMQIGLRVAPWLAGLLAWLLLHSWRPAVAVALAGTVTHSLVAWAKAWDQARVRPPGLLTGVVLRGDLPASAGFPSSHAAVAAAVAVALAPWVPRPLRIGLLAAAALAAVARMYVGVHLPLDVLGGAALGTCVAVVIRRSLTAPDAAP